MSEEFTVAPVSTPSPFQPQVTLSSSSRIADIPDEEDAEIGNVCDAHIPVVLTAGGSKEAQPVSNPPSVEDLERQKQELERQIAERQKAEKAAVIQQILDVAAQYNVTIEDLVEAMGGFKPKRKGVKATPKYRDPVSGITWSGRGKEPTWMRGQDREKFLIDE